MSKSRKPARENIDPNHGTGARSEEDNAEIRPVIEHLLIANASDTEIARVVGIDRKAVAHLRKSTARKPLKNAMTGQIQKGQESDRLTGEILRLRAEGLSYVEIADQVGLSWTSVRARLRVAYKDYMLEMRDAVAGRQVADLEVVRNELLEVIIRDHREDMEAVMEDGETWDEMDSSGMRRLLEKAYEKGRKNQDTKFRAMEVLLKLMDREAKLYGLDADKNVNVNHNITVNPAAIPLLQRLEQRELDNVVEAEIIEAEFELGNL